MSAQTIQNRYAHAVQTALRKVEEFRIGNASGTFEHVDAASFLVMRAPSLTRPGTQSICVYVYKPLSEQDDLAYAIANLLYDRYGGRHLVMLYGSKVAIDA